MDVLKLSNYFSAENNYAIQLASRKGHLEIVELLLQDPRVDPSADDNYAIGWASQNGHLEIIKLLLQDPRVDPSLQSNQIPFITSQLQSKSILFLNFEDYGRICSVLCDLY